MNHVGYGFLIVIIISCFLKTGNAINDCKNKPLPIQIINPPCPDCGETFTASCSCKAVQCPADFSAGNGSSATTYDVTLKIYHGDGITTASFGCRADTPCTSITAVGPLKDTFDFTHGGIPKHTPTFGIQGKLKSPLTKAFDKATFTCKYKHLVADSNLNPTATDGAAQLDLSKGPVCNPIASSTTTITTTAKKANIPGGDTAIGNVKCRLPSNEDSQWTPLIAGCVTCLVVPIVTALVLACVFRLPGKKSPIKKVSFATTDATCIAWQGGPARYTSSTTMPSIVSYTSQPFNTLKETEDHQPYSPARDAPFTQALWDHTLGISHIDHGFSQKKTEHGEMNFTLPGPSQKKQFSVNSLVSGQTSMSSGHKGQRRLTGKEGIQTLTPDSSMIMKEL